MGKTQSGFFFNPLPENRKGIGFRRKTRKEDQPSKFLPNLLKPGMEKKEKANQVGTKEGNLKFGEKENLMGNNLGTEWEKSLNSGPKGSNLGPGINRNLEEVLVRKVRCLGGTYFPGFPNPQSMKQTI